MTDHRTIVWINGALGAGKTSVADELARRHPDWLTFDAETVGFHLRHILHEPADGATRTCRSGVGWSSTSAPRSPTTGA